MQRSLRTILLAAVVTAPLLAACGDDDDTASTTTAATTQDTGAGATSSLSVHGTNDLKFVPATYEAQAGEVEFTLVNDGSIEHTLLIKGVGDFKLGVAGSGDTDQGSVELEPGEYTLYCDVAGHEAAGMVAELTVS
jgi:uncharacterized cupredoxin-like copper-binding protein